ncbi:ATP synthase subunit I [Moritella marina ATCC 15381]|uniref:ATP synthase subunit I n=1 Tax=Moritella marina ATCC 15381 TaxID=1202962 RepID=A0A5J6WQM9_MORMI|nr:ATP synthase subunit I [Moritella marina]QFI38662.1 ATP synthase subunit I [Moritella marina ATCC 15381]
MPHNAYELAIRGYALKLILGQLLLVIFIVSATYLGTDHKSTRSAALGGMIFLVPQYIFTRLSFLYTGSANIMRANTFMILGHACKFALIFILFSVILPLPEIQHFYLFITFVLVMFSQIFSLLKPLPEQFPARSVLSEKATVKEAPGSVRIEVGKQHA